MNELKDAPKTKSGNGLGQTKETVQGGTTVPMRHADSPIAYVSRLAEEMDRVFENFGMQTGWRMPSVLTRGHELLRREAGLVAADWSPQIDVLEKDGQFLIRADLPGMNKEDVKVEITDELISIQGERKHEKKEERQGFSYSERSRGTFYRAIPLPAGADASKATAQFQNGVLEIAMPSPMQAAKKARRLEIREGK